MTMAESAVEDAAAAPPGPAKPPPPSCTNNNTLAATANRNHHRASRKRRRLNQVLDDLNAHKSLPSEHETSLATTRLEVTSLASEEEEESSTTTTTMVFGSPRTASEHAVQAITKRLKAERLEGSTDEEVPPGNLPYQTYYMHNQNHRGFRVEEDREPDTSQRNNRENRVASLEDHQRIHHPHSHHNHHHHHHPHHHHHHHHHNHQQPPHQQASYHQQRATQKYRNCPCPNWVSQPLSAVLLPSPKSPLTPPTALTPLTPVSLTPLTPVSSSPSSYSFEQYFNTKYMPEVGRKRSHSDSDVAGRDQRSSVSSISSCSQRTPRGSSLESEPTCSPQDSPLDLSMKNLALVHNSVNSTNNINNNNNSSSHSNYNTNPTTTNTTANNRPSALQLLPSGHVTRGSVSVPVVRGDVASPTTKESVASRYNLEVSPVVEEMPPGADVAYVCPVCGQMFSLHDRLAKHMASRHRRQGTRDASAKAYRCEVCKRSFARSDMLTRHMRLHTGLKPYTCKVCNQVFSRSDHLSTHQRTHTGEKPYKCPQCVYAACRRDMITRHLRTHAKSNDGPVAKVETTNVAITGGGHPTGSESNPSYGLDPIPPGLVKME